MKALLKRTILPTHFLLEEVQKYYANCISYNEKLLIKNTTTNIQVNSNQQLGEFYYSHNNRIQI